MNIPRNIEWIGDASSGFLRLLDQTRLPGEVAFIDCRDVPAVWDAIKRLVVRGAPAIGVAAAYGCVLAVQPADDTRELLRRAADHLATSRPTAVNLFWALDRMKRVEPCTADSLLAQARRIHDEDAAMCLQIGEHGLAWIHKRVKGAMPRHAGTKEEGGSLATQDPGLRTQDPGPQTPDPRPQTPDRISILTHCNAGALATGGIGTATAAMYLAHERGLALHVFADETRPLLQGSRLTAFELASAGIEVTLICDGMAAQVMREGRVQVVITGADRIAANGDTANKIGTYSLAVLAKHHGIPFVVAAPSSTFDMSIPDGSRIPIEQRAEDEITNGFGRRTAPVLPTLGAYNPAFDVTPHELIAAIITERGVIEPVSEANVRRLIEGRGRG